MPANFDYNGLGASQDLNVTISGELAERIGTEMTGVLDWSIAMVFDGTSPPLWTTGTNRVGWALGNPTFSEMAFQFRFVISSGNYRVSAFARHSVATPEPAVNLTEEQANALGRRVLAWVQFDGSGSGEATMVLHDLDNGTRYEGTPVSIASATLWRMARVTRMTLGASDGFAGNADRQSIGGELGPFLLFDEAHPLSEVTAVAALNDLSALAIGPGGAWESSLVAAYLHGGNPGNTSFPGHIPGESVADGSQRIPVYARGSTLGASLEARASTATAGVSVVTASTRRIICSDHEDLGWVSTVNGTLAAVPEASVAGRGASFRALLAGATTSGITRIGVFGNSRAARRTTDGTIIASFPAYTDAIGANFITNGTAANYCAGLAVSLAGRCVGFGRRAWDPSDPCALPFTRMTAAAEGQGNAAIVVANTTGMGEGVARFGLGSEVDATSGVDIGDAVRLNPDNWASGGDSFVDLFHTAELGMDPDADRTVRVLFLATPMMSSSVEVQIAGRSDSAGTTVLPTVVATVDLSRPNLTPGVALSSVSGADLQFDASVAAASVGHVVCVRRSGQVDTQIRQIESFASTSSLALESAPTTAILDTDTVEIGDWQYVLLEVTVPASLIGSGVGQVPSNMVGVRITNTDADYPAYIVHSAAESTDASGVAVYQFGQGGRSFESHQASRPRVAHPDTGLTPYVAAMVALGLDGVILTDADQGANAGSGATAVADAARDFASEILGAGIDCTYWGGPVQALSATDWTSETNRVDFANKLRAHCVTLGIPYLEGYTALGSVAGQFAMGYRVDAAHHSILGATKWVRDSLSVAAAGGLFLAASSEGTSRRRHLIPASLYYQ